MKGNELREHINKFITDFTASYPHSLSISNLWRTPLVGYADVNHPYIRNLPYTVTDTHRLPEDFLNSPSVIISYFIPFTEELAATNVNVPNQEASKEWSDAYTVTNTMMAELNIHLAEEIKRQGYRAAVPENTGMIEPLLKSPWSQRHIAYAAGLGTFGLNNMLIGSMGCCGRYNSIVADIPVKPDMPLTEEKCLYKSRGACKKCVKNCFTGALTETGFDRFKCYDTCLKNLELYGSDVCGKCNTDIPCAFKAPLCS